MEEDFFAFDRFDEVAGCSLGQRFNHGLRVPGGADQQHRGVGILPFDVVQEFDSGPPVHRHIQRDEMDFLGLDVFPGRAIVAGSDAPIAFGGQPSHEGSPREDFILHDQDSVGSAPP